jgi:4-amino-4-deoxy-L-arabinose transferase-like glycosyltransferase
MERLIAWATRGGRIFNEWELLVLAVVTAAIYGARLTTLPIRGEETRRAEVATEILQTGDWIVPRQQGQPFLSRPPLGSYPIAALEMLFGASSLLAVRLPSVIATWLTTLLIYGYGRQFLSRLGSLAAGFAFATMGMVLQLGRLAETDAVFTLFVSGSLLLWHWGYVRNSEAKNARHWSRNWFWLAGYFCSALGALTKGPQAPVYFVGAATLYLLLRRDLRNLLSWSHLAAIGLFATVVGAWQIPFLLATDLASVRQIWISDVGLRFEDARWTQVVMHFLFYPIGVLICVLPWSPLLTAYGFKSFRKRIGSAQPMTVFLGLALLVAFPTCWLIPGAKERYFMPMFPCLSLLVGLVVQRALAADAPRALRIGWLLYLSGSCAAILFGGLAVAGASWIDGFEIAELTQPVWFAAVYLGLSVAILTGLLWRGSMQSIFRGYAFVIAFTAFVGLTHVGIVLGSMAKASEDASPAIAELKRKLPPHVRLVSFGLVETLFAYHYREPIEPRSWPPTASDLADGTEYFCFTWDKDYMPPFPFAWNAIADIPCDRIRHERPWRRVIVGRRLYNVAAGDLKLDQPRR